MLTQLVASNNLNGVIEIPSQSRPHIIIFSHGILSGIKESQRFKVLKHYLHNNRLATAGFYFPGHGPFKDSQYTLNGCANTLKNAVDFLKEKYPDFKISLLGVSLGSSAICLLNSEYIKKIYSIALFSLVSDPADFKNFKFEQHHYDRWKTFGYSADHAENMFASIWKESVSEKLHSLIISNYTSFNIPKLLIHGLNDRVTAMEALRPFIDQHSNLVVYSGAEGTHDLKGQSLEFAAKYLTNWFKG